MSEPLEDVGGDGGVSDGPQARSEMARGLQTRVAELLKLGQVDEAIEVSDRLLCLFAHEGDRATLVEVGDSVVGAASTLAWTRRTDQSVVDEALSRVVTVGRNFLSTRRERSGPQPGQDRQRRLAQALKMDDAVIARFGGSPDREFHKIAVEAHINRCGSLLLSGDVKQSAAVFNKLLSQPDSAYAEIAARETADVEQRIAAALRRGTNIGKNRQG